MKHLIFTALCFALICFSCHPGKDESPEKPNILFLLADDLGYGELGSYGQNVIRTPVLDELAEKGMRFTDFYAGNAVCSPSRAVLMTGKHAGHATIRGNVGLFENGLWKRVPLRKDEITLGELMKTAGYQTAFIGKWHLDDPDDLSTWAMSRGFDYVVQEQWSSPEDKRIFDERMHWINNMQDSMFYDKEKYECIDEFRTNFALEYLRKKDPSKPFFLFMSYRIPHAHERYIRNREMYAEHEWPDVERRHAARITMLDHQIGRLLDTLKQTGDLKNTLVIFTSDNGAHHELGHNHLFFNSTGGLKGYKRDLYEGGIRIPMIACWDGKIEPGTVSSRPGAFYDFMPTLAEAAGIETPHVTDGISLLPVMLGKEQCEHAYLYWEIQLPVIDKDLPDGGFRQAARVGKWKGVRYGIHAPLELYNLENDIYETTDLSEEYTDITDQMLECFNEAREETGHFPLEPH